MPAAARCVWVTRREAEPRAAVLANRRLLRLHEGHEHALDVA
jgi:hypothetical protein